MYAVVLQYSYVVGQWRFLLLAHNARASLDWRIPLTPVPNIEYFNPIIVAPPNQEAIPTKQCNPTKSLGKEMGARLIYIYCRC